MCGMGLHLLPLSVFVLLPTTFLTTYIIAVCLGHVEPGFPYISDTGTQSPESCIFGQLLNICAVLVGLTIYVRYQQVKEHPSTRNDLVLQRLNKVSLVLGLIAALGISLVGNFQETNVIIVHLIGAMMAFGVGAIYAWIQTFMSHRTVPEPNSRFVFFVRLTICCVISIAFVMMFVGASISFGEKSPNTDPSKWKPEEKIFEGLAKHSYHGKNPRKWFPKDGGYTWHVVSTASEWIMACSVLVYFATFIKEFQQLSLSGPKIHVHCNRSQPQTSYSSTDPLLT